jgi:hypothetical protein
MQEYNFRHKSPSNAHGISLIDRSISAVERAARMNRLVFVAERESFECDNNIWQNIASLCATRSELPQLHPYLRKSVSF